MSAIVGVCIIKARDFLINSVIGKRKQDFISLCLLHAFKSLVLHNGSTKLEPMDLWYCKGGEVFDLLKDITAQTSFAGGEGLPGRVTERIRSGMQNTKLPMAVEKSPILVVTTDKNGAIEYVNPKYRPRRIMETFTQASLVAPHN